MRVKWTDVDRGAWLGDDYSGHWEREVPQPRTGTVLQWLMHPSLGVVAVVVNDHTGHFEMHEMDELTLDGDAT